jgi:DNA-binding CsgD family transcriptional regulator
VSSVPRLNRQATKALAQLRLIASDASTAAQLAQRALDAIDLAVRSDLAALFALDPSSLLLTRVLALRGHTRNDLFDWVRDVYLVAGEPPSMQFPELLRRGGGLAAYHPDPDRWLRVSPETDTASGLAAAWHDTGTPAGGFLRCGLAHRRRWVGALQLARSDTSAGFRPSELEFLDRAAPTLGRALAERLTAGPDAAPASTAATGGRLLFDDRRRVVSMSDAAIGWLTQLDDDKGPTTATSVAVPFAAQSLVSHLAASGAVAGDLITADVEGRPVTIHGERLLHVATTSAEPTFGYCLTVSAAPVLGVEAHTALTNGQSRVARAVAYGLTDRQIAVQLGIAVTTVHEHVQAMHHLLDTHSRAELVAALHFARQMP